MPDPRPPLDLSNPKPRLDLLKIDFPTDNLTIKAIRQRFPQVDAGNFGDIELSGMLSLERDLAKAAFDEVLGRRTTSMSGEEEEMLSKIYVRYGLASGLNHTKQLIRAVQQAAADQARQHLPDQPSR
jgi:hypothetical protein